jgi:hypothetical protein
MMNVVYEVSDKIAAFLRGFASAFDLSGTAFIELPDLSAGFEQDAQALHGDWQRIGGDIRSAMDQVSLQIPHDNQ